ncbi:MAG: bifunctional (p)ppGpp synthetase/guanosine-3',5'-bis(diphosphate) 3'-pyrophosphohydrolase [Methylococcales bacterium]|nr:bifunctional (p)ppGpp synthetase/guanosine-3',5'-bis(diphosphate) 3'-pyrophosphohydrolase [Methylococcales bacterium]
MNDSSSQDDLYNSLKTGLSETEFAPIMQALEIPCRQELVGMPHPPGATVALILKGLRVDSSTLTAAILSAPLRDHLGQQQIEERFGPAVWNLVRNVRWLNAFNVYSPELIADPNQAEILRRMLLAMVDDVRAVVIKLGYQVNRLRNLAKAEYEVRRYIARETLDIYSRLANRLGIGQLKWELEDLSFRYLHPQVYKKIATSLTENRSCREKHLQNFVEIVKQRLYEENIKTEIFGRPKHIYSIWKKMQRKQVDFKDIYDLLAVRIIVDKVATCYSTLGVVHGLWQYLPQEFDDYIANPKTNGYQSLHTVVFGPENAMVEVQIRTPEMDQFAEFGIAAHWRYKEGGKHDQAVERSLANLRRLLDNKDDDQLLDDFRTDLYTDRIFVLTPKGEIKELRRGATPLDFAYSIHTEIGHRCRGAKVNQRIVPLSYSLQSGELVEILTTRNGTPSRNWLESHLGYLRTPNARSKVRHWFRKQDHDRNLRDGKIILEKQLQLSKITQINETSLARHFRLPRFEDLLISLGRADIGPEQLKNALGVEKKANDVLDIVAGRRGSLPAASSDITVQGVDNLLTAFAQCCKPVPGDRITGFISIRKGLVIHRQDCRNMVALDPEKQDRQIHVDWGEAPEPRSVDLSICAIDRSGLLRDITQILASDHINIQQMGTHKDLRDNTVKITLTAEICHIDQLSQTIDRIRQLPSILEIFRDG